MLYLWFSIKLKLLFRSKSIHFSFIFNPSQTQFGHNNMTIIHRRYTN